MTKQVQRRRGTATQHTGFTGAEGEISVNTTNKSVHVHDGVTAGGVEAARADLSNVSDANLNSALSGNTVASLTLTSADINGGTIDGVTIGGAVAGAGTFTTITGTSLDLNGAIEVSGGIYVGGTAAANLLDDYEEGTWTPTFASLTGAFGSITYAFNTGTYTKVGRLVTVTGRIQVSGTPPTIGTAGGNCHLSGFPFVIAPGQSFYGAMSLTFITGWTDSFAPNSAYISQGASLAVLMKKPVSNNNELIFTPADFVSGGANSGFMFTATYFTT